MPRVYPKAILQLSTRLGGSEGVPKIAARFGFGPSTVQRISRPFVGASAAVGEAQQKVAVPDFSSNQTAWIVSQREGWSTVPGIPRSAR